MVVLKVDCYLTAVRREKAGFYLSVLFCEVGRTDLHPVHGFSDLIKMVSWAEGLQPDVR